jgi:hypothetical protein
MCRPLDEGGGAAAGLAHGGCVGPEADGHVYAGADKDIALDVFHGSTQCQSSAENGHRQWLAGVVPPEVGVLGRLKGSRHIPALRLDG